jgi:HK97 family phage major capsid protein
MANENLDRAKQLISQLVSDYSAKNETDKVEKILGDVMNELKKANPADRKGRFDTKDATEVIKGSPTSAAGIKAMLEYPTHDPVVKSFQQLNDDIILLAQMLNKRPEDLSLFQKMQEHPLMKDANSFGGTGATMPTASTHYGADFIPLGFSADLIDIIRLQLKVAALHRRINMPTPQYKLPVAGATDMTAYLVSESTDSASPASPTISRPATTSVTLDAVKIGSLVYFSEEITEDSLIPVVPFLKDSMARAMANAQENAVINGQKTGNIDSSVAAADVRNAWDGYRYCAQTAAKVSLSTWTGVGTAGTNVSLLRSIRASMGKYGTDPKSLAWVTSISGYHQLLNIAEVQKLNEYGPNAVILNGELGNFDGIPIIVSEFVGSNLTAQGVYDGVTTTKTIIALVHTPSWAFGDRRSITVKTKDMPEYDNHLLVCHQRLDFKPLYAVASNYIVALGYGLANP